MLTLKRLRAVLQYEPETGKWIWLTQMGRRGEPGKQAGTLNHHGYRIIRIDLKYYRSARLAYFYINGFWPDRMDHINGVTGDDRWENLRAVTQSQNCMNRAAAAKNKGYKGVMRRGNKWIAQIKPNGKQTWLGRFESEIEAARAYDCAAIEAYGEFARLNFPKPPSSLEDFVFDPTPLKGPRDYSKVDALLAAMKKDLH